MTGHTPRTVRRCTIKQHPTPPHAGTLLDNGQLRARLSPAEVRFAQQFFVALGRSLKTSVLDDLPAQYQSLVSA